MNVGAVVNVIENPVNTTDFHPAPAGVVPGGAGTTMQTVPTPATGTGFAPPPVVPVYAPGQEPPVKKPPKKPTVPPAPPVTTLLVTEETKASNGSTLGIIGGKPLFCGTAGSGNGMENKFGDKASYWM